MKGDHFKPAKRPQSAFLTISGGFVAGKLTKADRSIPERAIRLFLRLCAGDVDIPQQMIIQIAQGGALPGQSMHLPQHRPNRKATGRAVAVHDICQSYDFSPL